MRKYKAEAPVLRFPEFKVPWRTVTCGEVLNKISVPVSVEPEKLYSQIGIRSHGKGIFHKDPVTGADLGNKRVFWVKENTLTLNIVFAWEQAVAKTSEAEKGLIASHRFPMYEGVEEETVDYLLWLFLTRRGKYLLELASPGGAGRNKTLGQKEFEKLPIHYPEREERKKISSFIAAVNTKTMQLEKKLSLAKLYKKGIMQKIFSQKIRFRNNEGELFENWKSIKLNELLYEHKQRNFDGKYSKNDVLSVSKEQGVVNQIAHLGRSYAGETIDGYHIVNNGDIVYTKSPLKDNPYGIIKCNHGKAGVVSTLYAVYSGKEPNIGEYLDYYFQLDDNTNRYLRPLVHKGAKNDMKINNSRVLIDSITVPSEHERWKIISFLRHLDKRINALQQQLELTRAYKQGLLQQMFI